MDDRLQVIFAGISAKFWGDIFLFAYARNLKSVNFEMYFWCLQIYQKNNERISALASEKKEAE